MSKLTRSGTDRVSGISGTGSSSIWAERSPALEPPIVMVNSGRIDPKEDSIMTKDVVKEIRRATRRKFSAEEKIKIMLDGLRGEIAVSELCRR